MKGTPDEVVRRMDEEADAFRQRLQSPKRARRSRRS